MNVVFTKSFVTRSLSPFVLVGMTILELISGYPFEWPLICANLLAACLILMLCPSGSEDSSPTLPFSAAASAVFSIITVCPFFAGNECQTVVAVSFLGLLCYDTYRALDKFANVRTLFRVDSVRCWVEDYSRLFYILVFASLCILLLLAGRFEAPWWSYAAIAAMETGFGTLSYMRAYTGKTLFISNEKEETIRHIIKGNLRNVPEYDSQDDHLNVVYNKVLRFMEGKKPFLDERFSVDDLASAVFSNKLYLSRAINYFSGRNFRQFVNYYRIMYAAGIMKKDRHIKVMELALMCGFHTVATFNMAFKLYMNMTPSAYYGVLNSQDRMAAKRSVEGGSTLA